MPLSCRVPLKILAEEGDINRFAKARLATKPFHSDFKVTPVDERDTLDSPKFLPVPTLKNGAILKETSLAPVFWMTGISVSKLITEPLSSKK